MITPYAIFFLSFFVLVVTNLGTFLRLDRPRTELIFRLKAFEAAVIRKASSLFALYLGWHVLYMIGRIYWNRRFFHLYLNDGRDDPHLLRHLELSRVVQLAWIAVLAILVCRLLAPALKAHGAAAKPDIMDDERVRMNWLKACRFSFLIVLALLLASLLPSFVFNITANHLPHNLIASVTKWAYVLSGLQLNLLAAVAALLGSYLYYDRKD